MREQELIVYRNFEDGALLEDMAWIMSRFGSAAEEKEERCPGRPRSRKGMAALFYDCIHRLIELAGNYGFHGNLWHCYLANLLVNNENSYSCGCELRGEIDGTVNEAALHDIVIFKEFYDFDFGPVMEKLQAPEFSLIENYRAGSRESKVYNARICARICQLAEKFCQDHTPEEMKDTLTRFYGEYGVGKFGLHKSFRVEHGENGVRIEPIPKIAHVALNDLVGYEIAKKKLTDNTDAFVAGRKANNCLLFGDAGTGKSSSIKALINEYYDQGLRMIELYKHQFQDLSAVIAMVKNRNYRFIIFIDDLSFEENEVEYKFLKAVIEGGVETKPDNVLLYATSNRRNLIRETWKDRGDMELQNEVHRSDTLEEKLSLSARFGVRINYSVPNHSQFQEIVCTLAQRQGVKIPQETLLAEANKWELRHGGVSGRTAQQFINHVAGSLETDETP